MYLDSRDSSSVLVGTNNTEERTASVHFGKWLRVFPVIFSANLQLHHDDLGASLAFPTEFSGASRFCGLHAFVARISFIRAAKHQ